MLKTDLEKLHEEKDPIVRQNGKTFDDCHTVAGLVGLEESRIICTVSQFSRINFIRPMLLTILKELEYTISKVSNDEIHCENSRIKFVSRFNSQNLEGYHDCVFVDFED